MAKRQRLADSPRGGRAGDGAGGRRQEGEKVLGEAALGLHMRAPPATLSATTSSGECWAEMGLVAVRCDVSSSGRRAGEIASRKQKQGNIQGIIARLYSPDYNYHCQRCVTICTLDFTSLLKITSPAHSRSHAPGRSAHQCGCSAMAPTPLSTSLYRSSCSRASARGPLVLFSPGSRELSVK